MHQIGAGLLANAPSWCSGGVVYLPHTLNRIPVIGRAGGSDQAQAQTVFLQIFYFLVKIEWLYSNKTGCKKRIAAHHFGSKFLFYKEKR